MKKTFAGWGDRPLTPIRGCATALALAAMVFAPGCKTTEKIIGGIVGATVVGASSPSTDIQQVYYIGVFDPQEQLPPQMYRIRLHGQSSFISATTFQSGWVPAPLIDSLSTQITTDKSGVTTLTKGAADSLSQITAGRRLVMFGPEGFREAPKDHRLVVVMGSSPEAFFSAIDQTLGAVADAQDRKRGTELQGQLFDALLRLREERGRLADLQSDIRVARDRAVGRAQ